MYHCAGEQAGARMSAFKEFVRRVRAYSLTRFCSCTH